MSILIFLYFRTFIWPPPPLRCTLCSAALHRDRYSTPPAGLPADWGRYSGPLPSPCIGDAIRQPPCSPPGPPIQHPPSFTQLPRAWSLSAPAPRSAGAATQRVCLLCYEAPRGPGFPSIGDARPRFPISGSTGFGRRPRAPWCVPSRRPAPPDSLGAGSAFQRGQSGHLPLSLRPACSFSAGCFLRHDAPSPAIHLQAPRAPRTARPTSSADLHLGRAVGHSIAAKPAAVLSGSVPNAAPWRTPSCAAK